VNGIGDRMPSDLPLVVSEVFGPTVQGEGPSAGRRCAFLRLGGCNLACRWCDTPYTWDWDGVADGGTAYDPKVELRAVPVADVLTRLLAYDVDLTVISGGEPLNQQVRLGSLVRSLIAAGGGVEIETNGTRVPLPQFASSGVRFNVSPKLSHSGDPENRRIVPDALRAFTDVPGTAFKFVCRNAADLDEVRALADRFDLRPVWIMPEGRTAAEISRHLADIGDSAVSLGWNITTRLHVAVWGDKRGV
jgi:7-carboxy-7-deazaguanine synthase